MFTDERGQAFLIMQLLLTIAILSAPGEVFDDSNIYLSVPLDVSLTEDRLPRRRKVVTFIRQGEKIEADQRDMAADALH